MSGIIELFLLVGFLVLMAMLWGLKKRIQTATETTASALESQRLAIERRVTEVAQTTASALESQRLAIERRVTEVAQTTASALESQRLAIERRVSFVLKFAMQISNDERDRHNQSNSKSDSSFGQVSQRSFSDQQENRPIFVATIFKSGTKLLEHIVVKLTGLAINAPTMSAGSDYESADPITFENGKFFIWHNVPSDRVKARLIVENAQPIFLIRNIYDLAVSQYFHFAHDVDAEIGYATHTGDYFAEMTQDEGISLLLSGATSERFNWHGFGYYLRQIQEMLQFSKEYPCHVVIYDRLVQDKRSEIERLATFLAIEPSDDLFGELIDSSSLNSMRKARESLVGSGNHFRKGTPGDHVNALKPWHYDMISQIKLAHAPRLDALCEELGFGDVTARSAEESHNRPSRSDGSDK